MNRREFSKSLAWGLTAAAVRQGGAQTVRPLHIGHTGITWTSPGGGRGRGGAPPGGAAAAGGRQGPPPGVAGGPRVNPEQIETIIRDIADLGFWGVELFGNAVTGMEDHGTIGDLLSKHHDLPLISIVASPNCGDPAKLQDSIDLMVSQGKVARKYGARIVLMNASGGRRDESYNFAEHKANIAHSLNEAGKAMAGLGLQAVLHQHTGTMVEKRDEVYGIMDAIDTNYVRAGFDVGQLAKGGADPVPIVRDFLKVIDHLHLKDYDGGEFFGGYCPLGKGRVDLKAVLDLMDKRGPMKGLVMVELDGSANQPMPAIETAKIAKAYLQNLGYQFRA
jgi:inosose dehydratase